MRRIFYRMPRWARFIFIPIIGAAFLALITFVVMSLWNNILPTVIHVEPITFWQAAGIFILCKILFGFGKMGGHDRKKMLFKKRMAERFKNMDPEERARFEERFGKRPFDRFRHFGNDKTNSGE